MPPAVTYKCTLTIKSIGQVIMFGLGSLLINIISNDISNAEQKNTTVKMVVVSYIPLAVTTVVVWCVLNHFFVEVTFHSHRSDADAQDTGHIHIVEIHRPGDPQVMERVDPQDTERIHPLGPGRFFPQEEVSLDRQDSQNVDPGLGTGHSHGTPLRDLREQETAGRPEECSAGCADAKAADKDYPRLLVDYFFIGPQNYAANKLERMAKYRDKAASATFPRSWTEFTSAYYVALSNSTAHAAPMFNDLAKTVQAKQSLIGVEEAFQPGVALRRSKAMQRRRSKS